MTLDERIEAVYQLLDGYEVTREAAEAVIRAAFPELLTDPPTAKLEPIEPPLDPAFIEMIAREAVASLDRSDSHLSTLKGEK